MSRRPVCSTAQYSEASNRPQLHNAEQYKSMKKDYQPRFDWKRFNFFLTLQNPKDLGRLCAYASLPLIPVPSKVILPAIMQHAVVMMVMMFGCGLEGW